MSDTRQERAPRERTFLQTMLRGLLPTLLVLMAVKGIFFLIERATTFSLYFFGAIVVIYFVWWMGMAPCPWPWEKKRED